MKYKYLFLLVLLVAVVNLSAIFDDYEPSPRARGMGGAFYSQSDDANQSYDRLFQAFQQ